MGSRVPRLLREQLLRDGLENRLKLAGIRGRDEDSARLARIVRRAIRCVGDVLEKGRVQYGKCPRALPEKTRTPQPDAIDGVVLRARKVRNCFRAFFRLFMHR